MEEKLILVLSKHRRFGWKFNIHWAREQADENVEILGAPQANEMGLNEIDEVNVKLIKLIDGVSDASLMRSYSKQTNILDFMAEVTQHTIDKLIRPRIEINNRKVIQAALQTSLPVYLRESVSYKILYPRFRIELLPSTTLCQFNFIKDAAGLRYYISLTNEESEISLQSKPAFILSEEPCVILLGNQIHRVEHIGANKLTPFFDKKHITVPASAETKYIQRFILKTLPKYEVKIEGIEMTEIFPTQQAVLVLEEDFFRQLTFFCYFQYNQ